MTESAPKKYPYVRSAWDTLYLIETGYSIARFGDGEYKLASGSPKNVSQINSPELRAELIKILHDKQKNLLIGIPDMNPQLPKSHIWNRYKEEYAEFLDPAEIYSSAFISRPDSDPSINTPQYFDRIQNLWRDQQVTLIGNGTRSLTKKFLVRTGAKEVTFVPCPFRDAYAEIDRIEKEATHKGAERVLICAGAAGTCLAARLSLKNFHAIDLGHIGILWRPYANPKSKIPPPEEYAR